MHAALKTYMFGIDRENPADCAARLAEAGIGAVVTGLRPDPAVQKAIRRQGLDLYTCFGAFSLGRDFTGEAHMARDTGQIPRLWFGSGCPNDPDLRQTRLAEAVETAAVAEVQGLFVDGARFASPASGETFDAFLTCFCPRCQQEAAKAGFDPDQMLRAVQSLAAIVANGQGKMRLPDILTGLDSWLGFRSHGMRAYYRELVRAVRRRLPDCPVGAFIFPASLARWVGQGAETVAGLDWVAPMLYRRYPGNSGPACLNHEWASLLEALTANSGIPLREAAAATGLPLAWLDTRTDPDRLTPEQIRQEGFLPETLARETDALVKVLTASSVAPIIQLADEKLPDSVRAVRSAGAAGLGFFAYQADQIERLGRALRA
ncbi:MAG: hypothetical protein M0P55_04015 [Clostridiales bacterium]|nr:hypothetical protein [Clostridiales bacterium]